MSDLKLNLTTEPHIDIDALEMCLSYIPLENGIKNEAIKLYIDNIYRFYCSSYNMDFDSLEAERNAHMEHVEHYKSVIGVRVCKLIQNG